MKKNGFWELLAILLVFSFIGCGNGNNDEPQDEPKTYTVTIGTLTNGSITANPTNGIEGTEITLTITGNYTYNLKAGSLKYGTTAIDETTKKFNLPAENVTITAEFVSSLFGSWRGGELYYTLTFFEDGICAVSYPTDYDPTLLYRYRYKGTWVPIDHNTVSTELTYGRGDGDDKLTLDEVNVVRENVTVNTWEILSDSKSIKRQSDGLLLTFVE